MREDLNAIASRLANLGVPPDLISTHVARVQKWRLSHTKPSLKRHRLNSPDDDAPKRKRCYAGATAVFNKRGNVRTVDFKPSDKQNEKMQ